MGFIVWDGHGGGAEAKSPNTDAKTLIVMILILYIFSKNSWIHDGNFNYYIILILKQWNVNDLGFLAVVSLV